MSAAGGGSIVNISSIEGFAGAAGLSAYSASKFAVRGITKAAAQELGHAGIRVNSIGPGWIDTNMTAILDLAPEDRQQVVRDSIPLGRRGTPEDIASAALFLATDESSYFTGELLHPAGGLFTG